MRSFGKIIFVILFAALLFSFGITARGESVSEEYYIVSKNASVYSLSDSSGEKQGEYITLNDCISAIDTQGVRRVVLNSVVASEPLTFFDGEWSISGKLTLSCGNIFTVCEGARVCMNGMTVDFSSEEEDNTSGGYLRLKGGEVDFTSGRIIGNSGYTVLLDYSSHSRLTITGGEIISELGAAIKNESGAVSIEGGKVISLSASAILNTSTLSVRENSDIEGAVYDIESDAPIRLSSFTSALDGLKIQFKFRFVKGTMTEILHGTDAASCVYANVYDEDGKRHELTFFESHKSTDEVNFAAVYLPYTVSFVDGVSTYSKVECLHGELIAPPAYVCSDGYYFDGWYEDDLKSTRYDFSTKIFDDTCIYASKKLKLPFYSISNIRFVYDGEERTLQFSEINHELDGTYTYEWYKDGSFVSSAPSVRIITVENSGRYKCKLKFSYKSDFVELYTDEIEVEVKKQTVDIPLIPYKKYSGEVQFPEIYDNDIYSVLSGGATDVGKHPVTLILKDSLNYEWRGGSIESQTVYFRIEIGDNEWRTPPTVNDYFENNEPLVNAKSRFGVAEYFYSYDKDGVYISGLPNIPGEYYFKAVVVGCDNYHTIESEPVLFEVKAERVVGIFISSQPLIREYSAFERFSPEGLALIADLNSGRQISLSRESVDFSYQSGTDCFRYGDSGILLTYGEAEVLLPITVKKAEYDVSVIRFEGISKIYSGNYLSIDFSGMLPKGKDSVPLTAEVRGGGTDVGVYSVSLVFKTESLDYKVPEDMSAVLTVLPREAELVWSTLSFVYNGRIHIPSAYFYDVRGIKTHAEVNGGRINAGDAYVAVATEPKNYTFVNNNCQFSISKADYDTTGVYLIEDSFVYDGNRKSVLAGGLPEGISIIGYQDNYATDAGEYFVRLSVSYDTLNYNEPKFPPLCWRIAAAEYDLSGLEISDTIAVYDGNIHYPKVLGDMPLGADGLRLEYRIISGAREVQEGRVGCVIEFFTESRNYDTPSPIVAFVQILPLPIYVEWSFDNYVYDGKIHTPSADSALAPIKVIGGGENAGHHKARAESLDGNYTVINDTCEFMIAKAENEWTSAPRAEDIYEGESSRLYASAIHGEVKFELYTDAELIHKTEAAAASGVYYAVATVSESENFLSLVSEPIIFKVIAVIPTFIECTVLRDNLKAFEILEDGDIEAVLVYNNGKRVRLSYGDFGIFYQNGNSLRVKDDAVTVEAAGLTVSVAVRVHKNSYEFSSLTVLNSRLRYNGEEACISVTGLPDGVFVERIEGGVGTDAGTYPYAIFFTYDSENYTEVMALRGEMVIEPAILKLPAVSDMVYSGEILHPELSREYVLSDLSDSRDVGTYYCTVSVRDDKNFILENGEGQTVCEYRIIPLRLSVLFGDAEKYLFEKWRAPEVISIDGSSDDDNPEIFFYEKDGEIHAATNNPNYELSYTPGKIVKVGRLSQKGITSAFSISLILVTVILGIFIVFKRREYILTAIARRRGSVEFVRENEENAVGSIVAKEDVRVTARTEEKPDYEEKAFGECEDIMKLDILRADSLLSDGMAKTLIKDGAVVYTEGSKRDIINVNVLSDNFAPGDKVDINDLKEKGLLADDIGYIKILADGTIDKPLKVYANAFSMPAVKMIALSGGEAIKSSTVRIKNKNK